jgi:glucoside 3-dehydrogenase (cytochrome c) hitch-hiker subunit
MNRREALRLLVAGAALPLLPSQLLALREARAALGAPEAPRTLNPHQFATVRTMAELILPRTDTPGAADVGATEFIDLILTEWYGEEDLNRFMNGLGNVDERTRALFTEDFVECTPAQQSDILTALGEEMLEEVQTVRDQRHEAPKKFYSMLRQLTLTAYYTSEAGATAELHFEIIPERYDACAPMTAAKEVSSSR